MLSVLRIENIAVVQQAEITFDRGFNVLTGETGAGKSIVVDAIGAVTGARASREMIRTGAKMARVEAVFTGLEALGSLEESDVAPDENGDLILEREIHGDGRNICRAGGRLVTVSQLRAIGRQLLNIHGQHDGQQLLDESCHLWYLDRFGVDGAYSQAYAAAYEKLAALRRELSALQMDEGEKSRRMDTLTYQIGELERAELRQGEEEELIARRDMLRNAERLTDAVDGAWRALTGGDEGEGVLSLLMEAEGCLTQGGRYSEVLSRLAGEAAQLRYAAEDLSEQVRDARGDLEFYPGELDEVESRLDLLHRLKKKYGPTVEDMLAFLEKCRRELDTIAFSEERVEQLEGELRQALAQARREGEALSQARRRAAAELEGRIARELHQLDMPRVRFQVEFGEKACQDGMDATGMDEVRFLMSANVGEDLKPIQKIASGGELSRIMLALKNVLAETDQVTTMVFDEVDAGVSGRAARKVAEKLYTVSVRKQVLCVTHLPQIASMGDVHFSVEKGEREGRTFTAVERLSHQRRKEELARLTGGAAMTPAMLEGAEELLRSAREYKERAAREGGNETDM